MMYLLFRLKNWKPSDYIECGMNERIILRAFMQKEIDEYNEINNT